MYGTSKGERASHKDKDPAAPARRGGPRPLSRRFGAWLLEPVPSPRSHWYRPDGFVRAESGPTTMTQKRPTSDDLSARAQDGLPASRGFSFRNPPPGWRVFLVAVVLAVPGALAGGMVSLYAGDFLTCSVLGALAGAVAGAVMEGRPPAASHDRPDEPGQDSFDDL